MTASKEYNSGVRASLEALYRGLTTGLITLAGKKEWQSQQGEQYSYTQYKPVDGKTRVVINDEIQPQALEIQFGRPCGTVRLLIEEGDEVVIHDFLADEIEEIQISG